MADDSTSETSPDLHYDFLIVGGGMVADAAARGIRDQGAGGSIGIVGAESTSPFPRPALSKKLWTDPDFSIDDAEPGTAAETGAVLHLGSPVVSIDAGRRRVTTDAGDELGYERLLIATGGHPRRLDGLEPGPRVLYFRTLTDYHRLRELAGDHPHVAVVGGGYIGSEIAAALVQNGCRVTLVHPDDVLGAPTFPAGLAADYEALFTGAGVELRGGTSVTGGLQAGDGVFLTLDDGTTLEAAAAVVGLGIEPSTGFVLDGLATAEGGGIVVDERLATDVDRVWAAGDVAQYPDRILGRRRVEHVDNAGAMGAAVGRIMAGSAETYDHTPMFYSAVFGVRWEAVGTLDASLETVVDRHEHGTVVHYLTDDEVVGVLTWDVGDDNDAALDAARALLARHTRPADAADLVGAVR